MALWSNSHITAVFGLAALVVWTFDWKKKSVKKTLLILFTGFSATLFTPYIGAEWLTSFSKAGHPFIHMYIREFQPASIYHPAFALLTLLAALLLFLLHQAPAAVSPGRLIPGLILYLGAWAVQKFIPYAAIYIAALVSVLSIELQHTPQSPGLSQALLAAREKLNSIPALWQLLSAALCLLATASCLIPLSKAPLDARSVPKQAVDFIEELSLPHPILNTFTDGGYLMYRFRNKTPAHLVPLDGRTNVNDPRVTKEFLSAFYAKADWQSYFQRVAPKTVIWPKSSPLVQVLLNAKDWCHVYPNPMNKLHSQLWYVFIRQEDFQKDKFNSLNSLNCKP